MKTNFKLMLAMSFIAMLTACGEIYDNSTPGLYSDQKFGYTEETQSENYKEYAENPFVEVSKEPISTFSVDADGGAFANMRRFMNLGQTPPKEAVRIEEFINYFTFDYAEPSATDNVAINSEIAVCPWNANHHLIRVGMKGRTLTASEMKSSNYVFLIDVSGSMSSSDKLEVLKAGFKLMTDELTNNDRVAIVTYAGSAAVLLKSTSGSEKSEIKKAIDKLGAGGSTAGAQGLITAYEIAEENFIKGGNNRIIIGSDGDFNVGPSSTEELIKLIEKKRESGVYLTALGVGSGNLNDNMMEQIANNGNGNYEYIDNADELVKIFINEKAKFYTVAKDSKIQITFNPDKVNSYRLIGYENRALKTEDFVDDTKDAGEIGSSQTITALYEVILTENLSAGKYAQFDFRYKKPDETESRLLQHEINSIPKAINSSSENMRYVAAVSAFGLIMRQSEFKGSASKQMVLDLANSAHSYDPHEYRMMFINIVNKWKE